MKHLYFFQLANITKISYNKLQYSVASNNKNLFIPKTGSWLGITGQSALSSSQYVSLSPAAIGKPMQICFFIVDQKWRDLVETGKASWVLHLKLTHCQPCLLLLLAKSKHMVISKVKNLGNIVYPLWNKGYSNRERRKFIQETQLTSFLFHFLSLDPRKCLTGYIH